MSARKDKSDARKVNVHGPDESADPPVDESAPKPEAADEPAPDAELDDAVAEPTAVDAENAADLRARLQRLAADYQNYQKRTAKEASQAREFANEGLLKELLPVIDDMERALAAGRENHDKDDPFLQGMQLVHDKAIEVLGRFGLTPIEAVGKPFDPDRHSALMQEESEAVEPMTVLREVQTGYDLKGRTLRPSGVIVAKAPEGD
jgi:molecular chaperone GrpE